MDTDTTVVICILAFVVLAAFIAWLKPWMRFRRSIHGPAGAKVEIEASDFPSSSSPRLRRGTIRSTRIDSPGPWQGGPFLSRP